MQNERKKDVPLLQLLIYYVGYIGSTPERQQTLREAVEQDRFEVLAGEPESLARQTSFLFRAFILEMSVRIENDIEQIAAMHFTQGNMRLSANLRGTLNETGLSLADKISVLRRVIQQRGLEDEYGDLCARLGAIRKFRNRLAHSEVSGQLRPDGTTRIHLRFWEEGRDKETVVSEADAKIWMIKTLIASLETTRIHSSMLEGMIRRHRELIRAPREDTETGDSQNGEDHGPIDGC